MIRSLSIKNFRGIKEGKIEGLGQVNIFIGKNNSGKSTLLDLLCFIKAPFKPTNEFGEFVLESLLQRRIRRNVSAEIEFFREYLPKNEIDVEAKFDNEAKLNLTAHHERRRIRYSLLSPDSRKLIATFSMTTKEMPSIQSLRSSGQTSEPLRFLFQSFRDRPSADMMDIWAYVNNNNVRKNLEFVSGIVLVDADFVRKIEKIENAYWAEILKRRGDKQLRDVLNQTYGLSIEGFSFANYRNGSSKLFSLLPAISMHIDDYGDGFRYAFSILTVASQAKNTALLLEEPEVHQHEGALRPLFEALRKLAMNNKLQIFISTHSLEVIRIWTQLTEDVKTYHLILSGDGKLEVRPIASTDAKLMMDLGVSPLRLDEPFSYFVLEGKEDRIFFESITKKLKRKSLKDFGYEVLQCPKDEQKTTVSALASTGKPIISCIDFDKKKNVEDLIKPFSESLKNKYVEVEVTDNKVSVKRTGSVITFIPMGLPNDKELSEVGISQYTMEDHLIKLICTDSNIQKWAGIDIKELRNRAQSLKDKAPLNSSKTLLMTLGVIKGGQTLEKLIPQIIDKSKTKSLVKLLEPIVTQLFA